MSSFLACYFRSGSIQKKYMNSSIGIPDDVGNLNQGGNIHKIVGKCDSFFGSIFIEGSSEAGETKRSRGKHCFGWSDDKKKDTSVGFN